MKVRDLLIFTFPGGGNDREVLQGGKALLDKYARKHTGRGFGPQTETGVSAATGNNNNNSDPLEKDKQPVSEGKVAESAIPESKKEISDAGQAWLFHCPPGTESVPEMVLGTGVFNPTHLRPDTGIYLVFHAEYLVPAMFGVDARTATKGPSSDLHENWENSQKLQAEKLVGAFKKLGIKEIRKICLVACNTANPKQAERKAFLESFVIELHNQGYHPMVAGWDIPIEVVTSEASANYGRKQVQSKPDKLLSAERKDHKFVYVYTGGAVKSFNVGEKVMSDNEAMGKKQDEAIKDFNKKLNKGSVIVESTLQKDVKYTPGKSSKTTVDMKLEFVQRTRYTTSGWSG